MPSVGLPEGKIEIERWKDWALSGFLASLIVLSFGILPFVDSAELPGHLVAAGFSVLLLSGALVGGWEGAFWRRLVLSLAAVGVVLGWLPESLLRGPLWLSYLLVLILFNALVCVALTRVVFRPGEITWHRLQGGAAVYVLIGFLFAATFVLIESAAPGSFVGLDTGTRDQLFRDAIYFSFVTLTTVGYGDVAPLQNAARNAAVLEALVGQIYLAMLIGRLVSLPAKSPS